MKLTLDPPARAPQDANPVFAALARWYDTRPAVRRLWGIRRAGLLRVIIAVEPTHDNDDIYPVWFANTGAWVDELSAETGSAVHLELYEASDQGLEIDADSVLVADLYWRDATL